jgi:nucleotide-binding universal stress UspA family protein
VFTRLLIGLDGSPQADAALEQGLLLGERFSATLVVATVHEGHGTGDGGGAALLQRAAQRVKAAGLKVEAVERHGSPDVELADLAKTVDAVLVGRRGVRTSDDALGPTVLSLIKIAEKCVIVCGGTPSPMRACAVAFDGGETSRRALELAARFASVAGSTVHVIHATPDRDTTAGVQVVGVAEAALSLQGVPFATHIEAGRPGEVVARVIARLKCDALFAGAHLERSQGRTSQPVVSHAEEILRHTLIPVVIQP